jgi:hypothetical protein
MLGLWRDYRLLLVYRRAWPKLSAAYRANVARRALERTLRDFQPAR